jgi:Cu(I)/Ag(I) efflux system protein CusF
MKQGLAFLLALAMWAAPHGAVAQSLIEGQITKVDAEAGKITIKHGPIKKLGMDEGMTMVFKAQDPAMLKAVKAGDRVKFDADDVNGQLTLTKIVKGR